MLAAFHHRYRFDVVKVEYQHGTENLNVVCAVTGEIQAAKIGWRYFTHYRGQWANQARIQAVFVCLEELARL